MALPIHKSACHLPPAQFKLNCQLPLHAPEKSTSILFKKINKATDQITLTEKNKCGTEVVLPDSDFPTQTAFIAEMLREQEQEKQNLAADLQENIGQSLILMKNQVLQLKQQILDEKASRQLNSLTDLLTETLQKIRNISFSLRPYELDLLGLTHAICRLTEEVARGVTWPLAVEIPLVNNQYSKENEIFLYRLLQECLCLVAKQTDVKAVYLQAQCGEQTVEWKIEVAGSASFLSFIKAKQSSDFYLLRLQELLKIMAGNVIFTQSGEQAVTMYFRIPVLSSLRTHEKA